MRNQIKRGPVVQQEVVLRYSELLKKPDTFDLLQTRK